MGAVTLPPAVLSWSSGKDSAFALHTVRQEGLADVRALLTTVNETFGRVSIHGTPVEILRAQAAALDLPMIEVPLPFPCPNEVYEARMAEAMDRVIEDGMRHAVFGDLFLEDIRAYREANLETIGVTALFPLWDRPTDQLARDMLSSGLETYVASVDLAQLDAAFAGRRFDEAFLADLPGGVDPCGENGEFHTCVAYMPGFSARLPLTVHETVVRDGFAYADIRLT